MTPAVQSSLDQMTIRRTCGTRQLNEILTPNFGQTATIDAAQARDYDMRTVRGVPPKGLRG